MTMPGSCCLLNYCYEPSFSLLISDPCMNTRFAFLGADFYEQFKCNKLPGLPGPDTRLGTLNISRITPGVVIFRPLMSPRRGSVMILSGLPGSGERAVWPWRWIAPRIAEQDARCELLYNLVETDSIADGDNLSRWRGFHETPDSEQKLDVWIVEVWGNFVSLTLKSCSSLQQRAGGGKWKVPGPGPGISLKINE